MVYVGGASLVTAVWQFTFEAPFPLNLVIVGVLALIGAIMLGLFINFKRNRWL